MTHQRIHFFETIAPCYDLLLDIFTFGNYVSFLKRAVDILAPDQGENLLDLCSGTGRAASWMADAVGTEGKVIGMDLSKNMIEVARHRYGNSGHLIFLLQDVTQSWKYQDFFDGIFTSFSIHELPGKYREDVFRQSYLALKARGRMVIADFNPQVSGMARLLSLLFFKLFERRNLNFFDFQQNETLKRIGFKRIKTFSVFGGVLQITLACKH